MCCCCKKVSECLILRAYNGLLCLQLSVSVWRDANFDWCHMSARGQIIGYWSMRKRLFTPVCADAIRR